MEDDNFELMIKQSIAFLRGRLLDLKHQQEKTHKWNLIKLIKLSDEMISIHRKIISFYTLMILHRIS